MSGSVFAILPKRLCIDAMFVPGIDHFDGGSVPATPAGIVDVITVEQHIYARWASGELPAELGERR